MVDLHGPSSLKVQELHKHINNIIVTIIETPHLNVEKATNRIATDTGFLMFLQKCSKMGNQDFYSWLYDDQRTAAAAAVAVAGTEFEAF